MSLSFGLGKANIRFLVMTFSQQENGPLKKIKKQAKAKSNSNALA